MSFYIFIDSRNKITGKNYNFRTQLNAIHEDLGHTLSVSVESISFHNLEYPINAKNNVIQFQENGSTATTFTATLTEGVYTADELRAEIETQLNAAPGAANTYTVSYSAVSKKYTITLSLPDTFLLVDIDAIYGFTGTAGFLSVRQGDSPIQIDGARYVDLLIPSFSSPNISNNFNQNVFRRIPAYAPYGGLITWASQESDDAVVVGQSQLHTVEIELRDDRGDFFLLPDTANVSIVLKASYSY